MLVIGRNLLRTPQRLCRARRRGRTSIVTHIDQTSPCIESDAEPELQDGGYLR